MGDHNIEWYHRERGGRGPESSTGAVVSHLPGVRNAVHDKGRSMASEAWLQLSWHRRTGAARIEFVATPWTKLDAYVMLVDADPGGHVYGVYKNQMDRSAMSIEFGWTQTHVFGKKMKHPVHHDGLHILEGVMNRAIRKHGGR